MAREDVRAWRLRQPNERLNVGVSGLPTKRGKVVEDSVDGRPVKDAMAGRDFAKMRARTAAVPTFSRKLTVKKRTSRTLSPAVVATPRPKLTGRRYPVAVRSRRSGQRNPLGTVRTPPAHSDAPSPSVVHVP